MQDCEDCQKTLKDHLRQCADYGKLPAVVQKCADLPGGCSVGKPDTCPAPPPVCPPACPPKPKCDVPDITFTCPTSDCGAAAKSGPSSCCPPPPTKVEQCPPKKVSSNCNYSLSLTNSMPCLESSTKSLFRSCFFQDKGKC